MKAIDSTALRLRPTIEAALGGFSQHRKSASRIRTLTSEATRAVEATSAASADARRSAS